MPIYEYTCKSCGHDFEDVASIKAPPLTDCPKCGKPEAQRQITGTSFVLKGGAWAREGYSRG